MTRLTIDAETRTRLVSSGKQVELCDEQGGRVGYFMSEDEYHRLIYAWAHAAFAAEEIDRSPPAADDFSTPEAIAHLERIVS